MNKQTEEITVTDFRRKRKWGWGWSCNPMGEDAWSIEFPAAPDYVGTLNQLDEAIKGDVTFHNLGGAFYNVAWFWEGRRIISTWRAWASKDGSVHHGWLAGFHPYGPDNESDLKIQVVEK